MERLLDDWERQAAWGRASRVLAVEFYTQEVMVERYPSL